MDSSPYNVLLGIPQFDVGPVLMSFELNVSGMRLTGLIKRATLSHMARCTEVGSCWLGSASPRVSWACPHALCLMVPRWLPLFQELSPLCGRNKWGEARRAVLAESARKQELSPSHPPEDFHLPVMGKNWVTWPRLAARVWDSQCSRLLASIREGGHVGYGHWSLNK